jgi:hypothetical protein
VGVPEGKSRRGEEREMKGSMREKRDERDERRRVTKGASKQLPSDSGSVNEVETHATKNNKKMRAACSHTHKSNSEKKGELNRLRHSLVIVDDLVALRGLRTF